MWLRRQLLLGAALVIASCDDGGPTSGAMNVRIVTSGTDVDDDGFLVVVDGTREVEIPPGEDNLEITGLAAGTHSVELRRVAGYCTVDENPRQVELQAGRSLNVPFDVNCAVTGADVRAHTTGLDVDPDGFGVRVDGENTALVSAGGVVRITRLDPGAHTLTLSGVAGNCSVISETPMSFTVVRGEVAKLDLAVHCRTMHGVARVEVRTTGEDRDLNGYTAISSGTGASRKVHGTATVFLDKVPPGPQEVRLDDIARNCTVPNGAVRPVSVRAGTDVRDTVTVAFDVACTRVWDIVYTHVSQPSWSPSFSVMVATSDFTQVEALTNGADPSWSPDGNSIAFHDPGTCDSYYYSTCPDAGLAVIGIDGSNKRVITEYQDREPAWSPDGSRIAFVRAMPNTGRQLGIIGSDGSGLQILTIPAATVAKPSWSPDGRSIAFECGVASFPDICFVNADGTRFRRVEMPLGEGAPDWSPDGSRLVFVQRDAHAPRLATMAADGTDLRISDAMVGAADPVWLPDGRIMFVEQSCSATSCVNRGVSVIRSDWTGLTTLISSAMVFAPDWRR